jgi:hypothetical protein
MTFKGPTICSMFACCVLLIAGSSHASTEARPDHSSSATTKPWVEDFAGFASSTSGKRWIVGRSTSPCLSENEAFEAASRDACAQLSARVRPRLTSPNDFQSDAWLQRRLAQELAAGHIIADRSVARVRRPYGELWSEAILVDASNDRLSGLAREHADWLSVRRHTRRSAVASIVGLSLAILLIYAALNAVTSGYFRGRLRAGAALMLAMCLLAVIYWIQSAG